MHVVKLNRYKEELRQSEVDFKEKCGWGKLLEDKKYRNLVLTMFEIRIEFGIKKPV